MRAQVGCGQVTGISCYHEPGMQGDIKTSARSLRFPPTGLRSATPARITTCRPPKCLRSARRFAGHEFPEPLPEPDRVGTARALWAMNGDRTPTNRRDSSRILCTRRAAGSGLRGSPAWPPRTRTAAPVRAAYGTLGHRRSVQIAISPAPRHRVHLADSAPRRRRSAGRSGACTSLAHRLSGAQRRRSARNRPSRRGTRR